MTVPKWNQHQIGYWKLNTSPTDDNTFGFTADAERIFEDTIRKMFELEIAIGEQAVVEWFREHGYRVEKINAPEN